MFQTGVRQMFFLVKLSTADSRSDRLLEWVVEDCGEEVAAPAVLPGADQCNGSGRSPALRLHAWCSMHTVSRAEWRWSLRRSSRFDWYEGRTATGMFHSVT